MKAFELRERLEKAQANVEKIQKTIARHEAQAEKKKAIIESNGWTFNRFDYNDGHHDDAYWTICEYEGKLSDIKGANQRLGEAIRIAKNWEAKLERQLEIENKLQNEIPEVFKQVRDELVNIWVVWDIAERERMHEAKARLREECGDNFHKFYNQWYKMYPYTREESLNHTDEEFRKIEEKEADMWLLDLYNRVYAITGEVTDCSRIAWGGKCLDGVVVGKNGTAVVNTIEAGGYNIQRFHLRTLVKEVKEV